MNTNHLTIIGENESINQFSRSVVSNSLRLHESQHARPLCPSPTPGVHSNSCPSSQWCHPAISILCRPLLLLPPNPPSIRGFSNESALHMSWSKYWSFSVSISPSSEHRRLISFRMDWLDLLESLLQNHSWKHQFFSAQLSLCSNSHIHTWLLEKA